jgi:hypothetical protein
LDIAENGRRVVIELNGLLNAELYASDPVLVVQALVARPGAVRALDVWSHTWVA